MVQNQKTEILLKGEIIFNKNYVQELHYTHKYLWKMNVFPKKDPRNNELWSENFESFGGKRFFFTSAEIPTNFFGFYGIF